MLGRRQVVFTYSHLPFPLNSTVHCSLAASDNGLFCSSQAVLQVPVLIQAPEEPEQKSLVNQPTRETLKFMRA